MESVKMIRPIRTIVACTAALAIALGPAVSASGEVAETEGERISREIDEQRARTRTLSHKEASAPQVRSVTQYDYGKLSCKFEDEPRHYYVPAVDDVFLLSDYRETHRAFRDADVTELDAGVTEATISADLRRSPRGLVGRRRSGIKARRR